MYIIHISMDNHVNETMFFPLYVSMHAQAYPQTIFISITSILYYKKL